MQIGDSISIDGDVTASGKLGGGGPRHRRRGTRFSWGAMG